MQNELAIKYSAITDIQARRSAFLKDIKDFYNLDNRALITLASGHVRCSYAATDVSPGCAIGRCLERDDHTLTRKEGVTDLDIRPPVWMMEMGLHFLAACQKDSLV